MPQPYDVLDAILAANPQVIIFDRTSYVNKQAEACITIQQVPDSICRACYPCHFFVEETIRNYVTAKGYQLYEVFESSDKLCDSATWKGHIFTKAAQHGSTRRLEQLSTQESIPNSCIKMDGEKPKINSIKTE